MALNKTVTDLITSLSEKATTEADRVTFPADVYAQSLPESLSLDVVNQVNSFNGQFQLAATVAFAQAASGLMDADSNVDAVSLSPVSMGDGATLGIGIVRPAEGPNYMGDLLVTYALDNDILEAREHLATMAASAMTTTESAELED